MTMASSEEVGEEIGMVSEVASEEETGVDSNEMIKLVIKVDSNEAMAEKEEAITNTIIRIAKTLIKAVRLDQTLRLGFQKDKRKP